MSMKSKYDCGCEQKSSSSKTFGSNSGCNATVQSSPAPCCESHDVKVVAGICLQTSCTIIATTEPFHISFSNLTHDISPLNANEQFFYHGGAGLLRILSFDGTSYQVSLVDSTRQGASISPEDCVSLAVVPSLQGSGLSPFSRCLEGLFSPPALSQTATIFIFNGAGIPIGSTISFSIGGELGSYTVVSLVSSTEGVYTYQVRNDGSGHTPGISLSGGGNCAVAINVETSIDICDLSVTTSADRITSCVNGAPRGVESAFADSILAGDGTGKWVQKQLPAAQCCVITQGTVKFTGITCPANSDSVILQPTGLDCFIEAFNFASSRQQGLPMVINGLPIVATAYNVGTRQLTLIPVEPGAVSAEFPAGTQICIGECCKSCTNGVEISDFRNLGGATDGESNAFYEFVTAATGAFMASPANSTTYWLIGAQHTAGTLQTQQLDAGYFANPSALGPRLPRVTDALVLRQKLCNSDVNGCSKHVKLTYNFQMAFDPYPAGVYIDWELGSYIDRSQTLSDNSTPNPFSDMSSNAKISGRLSGPSFVDSTILNSGFGQGAYGSAKVFPFASDNLVDHMRLPKCACGLALVWWFMRITNTTADAHNIHGLLRLRRIQEILNENRVPYGLNQVASQGF